MKIILLCASFLIFAPSISRAQDDFCEGVTAILHDAPNQFRNVRGNISETGPNADIFKPSFIVQGTINSRFVATMGLFYEGALCQTKVLKLAAEQYEAYKLKLNDCLTPLGYKMRLHDNFYPGLSQYKKVVFLPDFKDDIEDKHLPGHVTMELDYNKSNGAYTLIVYIYNK